MLIPLDPLVCKSISLRDINDLFNPALPFAVKEKDKRDIQNSVLDFIYKFIKLNEDLTFPSTQEARRKIYIQYLNQRLKDIYNEVYHSKRNSLKYLPNMKELRKEYYWTLVKKVRIYKTDDVNILPGKRDFKQSIKLADFELNQPIYQEDLNKLSNFSISSEEFKKIYPFVHPLRKMIVNSYFAAVNS